MDYLPWQLDALEHIISGEKKPDSLDLQLLRQLTGNFSDDRKIGEGGCGEVYKGILPNGVVIAVKKLKSSHTIDEKMFLREVDTMIKVKHQNIVRFIGYCSETKEKALEMDGKTVMAEERERLLCFEYIRKGSIDNYLTDELRGFEWRTRYEIIKGICNGLLHLHMEKRILHMDLKPANILLSDQMVPKITDFGLSRIDGKSLTTSAQRLFSPGYCAPEYIINGKRSSRSDIYSLGVIIIEVVTGSRQVPSTTKVLRKWRHRWNKSSKHIPMWYQQVKKCLELAMSCKEKNPINRPLISDVVRELKKLEIRESSLEKIISSSDDMLGIEPLELHFTLARDKKQISCSIELTNDTDYYMAFRIATTSLLPFSIQPAKGIAAPRSKCTTSITLPAQEMILLHSYCKEEFIVQSTRIDGCLAAVDITDDMFNDEWGNSQKKVDGDKVVDEVNLTVVFNMLHEEHQKNLINLSAEMASLGTSSQVKGAGRGKKGVHETDGNGEEDVSTSNHSNEKQFEESSQLLDVLPEHLEVQQSMELSPHHHDYEDPSENRNSAWKVLERILDGRQSPSPLPFSLLQYITEGFSAERKISGGRGRSGDGEVYKGIFGDKIVAVRRLFKSHTIIDDSVLHREIATTITAEHKNIVRFLGYCDHTENVAVELGGRFVAAVIPEILLCFEYISNGSLGKYLTDELRGLEWHTRYQIILEICEGLQYLHKEKRIVHLSLRPSNILIGDHMVPKIAEFCLSRIKEETRWATRPPVGIEYFAPEYKYEGKISAKSDIYSLGVIIIELVTGSKELTHNKFNSKVKAPNINNVLRRWMHRWNKSAKYMYNPLWQQQVTKCLKLASRCLHDNPTQRPHVWQIIQELESDRINSCLDDMLGVEPLELHFPVELNTQHSRSIQLTNDTDHCIAFVITTETGYSTQPDKEVVPPRSMYSVTITSQAQEKEPRTRIAHWKDWKEEITVLSTRVDVGVTAADISLDMFNEEKDKVVDKVKVTIILDTP